VKLRRVFVVLIVLSLAAGCRDRVTEYEEAAVPVRVVETTRGSFTPKLLLYGTVRPGRTYALTAGPGGTISYPRRFAMGLRTGERVARGEEVAWVENEDARLALVEARLDLELATTQLARTQASFEHGLVARVELERDELRLELSRERLKAAKARAARRSVRVPDSGVLIVDRVVAPQSEVAPGDELALVALDGLVRVEALAAAADRARLVPGQAVRISRRDGVNVDGKIVEVSKVVDDSGTIKVVAEPYELEGLPAPGEGVELLVNLAPLSDVVAIPEESLVFGSSDQTAVFVIDAIPFGENLARARRVDVVVGGRSDDRVAVMSGLTSGELVVTAGAAMLAESTLVKVTREEEKK
jgi:membrane fusion protein (multidrug efflux system)